MRKRALPLIAAMMIIFSAQAFAQENPEESFFRARVVFVKDNGTKDLFGTEVNVHVITAELLDGPDQGKTFEMEYRTGDFSSISVGEKIVVSRNFSDPEGRYQFFERYRLNALIWLLVLFIGLTVAVSGFRGFSSFVGLLVTLVLLTNWIVPEIVAGKNPLMTSFLGSLVIATISLFLAHGFRKRTVLSWISTVVTLAIAVILSVVFVEFSQLFGMGSEEAVSLTMSSTFENLDLKGLLLGAIVIGVLGILDDVTTTQTATVEEIANANQQFTRYELYRRGLSVGKEHIASLVNTLVIAYAGASLPIFLIMTMGTQPFWIVLNNEFLAEEVVRTLVGSATLIIAVPVSTIFAAMVYASRR